MEAGDNLEKKNKNDINPLTAGLQFSMIFFLVSSSLIYVSDYLLLNIQTDDLSRYIRIQYFRPYIFTLSSSVIVFFLVYKNLSKIKKYKDTINLNLKEISYKEIDLYQAECRINNQKDLMNNIIQSASLLILSLDKDLNITKIEGDLELFTSLQEEDILNKKLDFLFETPLDIDSMASKVLKNLELKLFSNPQEEKYILMNIDSNKFISKSQDGYTAVIIDITQKKLLENQVHYLDYYDPITDLPNRVLLELKYKNLKSKRNFNKSSLAFLYVDLDDFKHINESLSHNVGDKFLRYISKLLKDSISENDILSRITQDEFGIILSNVHSKKDIEKVIKKIYNNIGRTWTYNGNEYNPSVTIGISIAPFDGDSFDVLLKNAHLSSEHLKVNDKGNYQYYSKHLEKDVLNSLKIVNELKRAIIKDEFILHYQTIVDLRTNELLGAEALVRWIHPERGMVSPMEFIPIVEKTSLTYQLMNLIVDKALKQKKDWNAMEVYMPKLSINISSKSFSQKNFHLYIEESIKDYGLSNDEIVLELTESGFTDNIKDIEVNINHLRSIGVEIAMDDFGTGYSTLARLKEIPIDYLKLDKTFIDKMTKDSEEEIMVKSVITLAKTFGLKVLAEGIETQEQFELLQDLDCDYGQGYYMSKPVTPDKIIVNRQKQSSP